MVLLAADGHAPDAAAEFVAAAEVGEVVAVGGRLDQAAVAEIAGGVPTRRVAGATRFDTAAELAGRVTRQHGGAFGQPAWLAAGEGWPDALVAAPAAASQGAPLLLAPADDAEAAPPTRRALRDLGSDGVAVVGGEAGDLRGSAATAPPGWMASAASACRWRSMSPPPTSPARWCRPATSCPPAT